VLFSYLAVSLKNPEMTGSYFVSHIWSKRCWSVWWLLYLVRFTVCYCEFLLSYQTLC